MWEVEKRLNLLDSIVRGLPIGSLLVWRTTQRELQTYPKLGGIALPAPSQTNEKVSYLIDGHQRLATLFGALYPGVSREHTRGRRWPIYFELGTIERPAFRPPPRGPVPHTWLPLDIVFDGDKLYDFNQQLRERGNPDLARDAARLSNLFKDYIIPIVPLNTEDLDIVTDAFVRINSQGKKMSEAHMLRALTHLKESDTEKGFSQLRSALSPFGWEDLDDQTIVNALKAKFDFDVYGSGVREVYQALENNTLALSELVESAVHAVDFLSTVGIRGPGALPYAYQLVTLMTLAARMGRWPKDDVSQQNLKQWFWQTTYSEHFTGITGSTIREGIRNLESLLNHPAYPDKSASLKVDMLQRFRTNSVRSKAFLLFMAQLPQDQDACLRRESRLAVGGAKAAPKLFANGKTEDPANHVIADPLELRKLRRAIKDSKVPSEMADEWAIPLEALEHLDNEARFLDVRRAFLHEREQVFVKPWNMELVQPDPDFPEDEDDEEEELLSDHYKLPW